MHKTYSITLRIVSVTTLLAFLAVQVAWGYEDRGHRVGVITPTRCNSDSLRAQAAPQLRSGQAGEGNAAGEVANALGGEARREEIADAQFFAAPAIDMQVTVPAAASGMQRLRKWWQGETKPVRVFLATVGIILFIDQFTKWLVLCYASPEFLMHLKEVAKNRFIGLFPGEPLNTVVDDPNVIWRLKDTLWAIQANFHWGPYAADFRMLVWAAWFWWYRHIILISRPIAVAAGLFFAGAAQGIIDSLLRGGTLNWIALTQGISTGESAPILGPFTIADVIIWITPPILTIVFAWEAGNFLIRTIRAFIQQRQKFNDVKQKIAQAVSSLRIFLRQIAPFLFTDNYHNYKYSPSYILFSEANPWRLFYLSSLIFYVFLYSFTGGFRSCGTSGSLRDAINIVKHSEKMPVSGIARQPTAAGDQLPRPQNFEQQASVTLGEYYRYLGPYILYLKESHARAVRDDVLYDSPFSEFRGINIPRSLALSCCRKSYFQINGISFLKYKRGETHYLLHDRSRIEDERFADAFFIPEIPYAEPNFLYYKYRYRYIFSNVHWGISVKDQHIDWEKWNRQFSSRESAIVASGLSKISEEAGANTPYDIDLLIKEFRSRVRKLQEQGEHRLYPLYPYRSIRDIMNYRGPRWLVALWQDSDPGPGVPDELRVLYAQLRVMRWTIKNTQVNVTEPLRLIEVEIEPSSQQPDKAQASEPGSTKDNDTSYISKPAARQAKKNSPQNKSRDSKAEEKPPSLTVPLDVLVPNHSQISKKQANEQAEEIISKSRAELLAYLDQLEITAQRVYEEMKASVQSIAPGAGAASEGKAAGEVARALGGEAAITGTDARLVSVTALITMKEALEYSYIRKIAIEAALVLAMTQEIVRHEVKTAIVIAPTMQEAEVIKGALIETGIDEKIISAIVARDLTAEQIAAYRQRADIVAIARRVNGYLLFVLTGIKIAAQATVLSVRELKERIVFEVCA